MMGGGTAPAPGRQAGRQPRMKTKLRGIRVSSIRDSAHALSMHEYTTLNAERLRGAPGEHYSTAGSVRRMRMELISLDEAGLRLSCNDPALTNLELPSEGYAAAAALRLNDDECATSTAMIRFYPAIISEKQHV